MKQIKGYMDVSWCQISNSNCCNGHSIQVDTKTIQWIIDYQTKWSRGKSQVEIDLLNNKLSCC